MSVRCHLKSTPRNGAAQLKATLSASDCISSTFVALCCSPLATCGIDSASRTLPCTQGGFVEHDYALTSLCIAADSLQHKACTQLASDQVHFLTYLVLAGKHVYVTASTNVVMMSLVSCEYSLNIVVLCDGSERWGDLSEL